MSTKVNFKQNAMYIPHLDQYIVSTHVHDFREYTHTDGRYVYVDGGTDYFRSGGNLELYTEGVVQNYCLDSKTSRLFDIRLKALWGTRGKDGTRPLAYRPIRTFTRAHLRAIKKNCASYMHPILLDVVKFWLKSKYNE